MFKLVDREVEKFSKIFMTSLSNSVPHHFFAPAHRALASCQHTRNCNKLSDSQWIKLGVSRVIDSPTSGRGFLQNLMSQGDATPSYTHFFETLKSSRRLSLCEEVNEAVANKKLSGVV